MSGSTSIKARSSSLILGFVMKTYKISSTLLRFPEAKKVHETLKYDSNISTNL